MAKQEAAFMLDPAPSPSVPDGGPARYDDDVAAWAAEQARLLRAGRFDLLDIERIADEIEDVGKSEARELASRMEVLLMHLAKWQCQPSHRSASWTGTIRVQRQRVQRRLKETPSLRSKLDEAEWLADAWDAAIVGAAKEIQVDLDQFPATCPWLLTDVITDGWLPA